MLRQKSKHNNTAINTSRSRRRVVVNQFLDVDVERQQNIWKSYFIGSKYLQKSTLIVQTRTESIKMKKMLIGQEVFFCFLNSFLTYTLIENTSKPPKVFEIRIEEERGSVPQRTFQLKKLRQRFRLNVRQFNQHCKPCEVEKKMPQN